MPHCQAKIDAFNRKSRWKRTRPARYLEPNEVKKVAKALKTVSKKDLISRFNLEAMKGAKVYACRDEGELQLVQLYFTQVCNYYEETAARGDAMLLYLD